jgi:precorrin-6B methylase 2
MSLEAAVLPPQARAMQVVQTAVAGKLMATLTQAGVPDALGDDVRSIGEIAQTTGLDADALARALRAAALLGMVERASDGRWRNTELGRTLRSDVPGSIRDYVVYALHDGNWRAWQHLMDTLRNGEPSFARANGGLAFWEYLDANPGVADAFHHAMAAATALTVRALPAAMRLDRFRRVADIGGGSGLVLAEILCAAPHITGILFDRAEAIEAGRQRFSAEGLSGRVTLETGDLLTQVPTGADAYILKNILHDHTHENCGRILEAVRAAMAPEGRLFVIEAVLPDAGAPHPAVWRDLHMMVALGGRERTEAEWRTLLGAHRFGIDRIVNLPGPDAVIETCPDDATRESRRALRRRHARALRMG